MKKFFFGFVLFIGGIGLLIGVLGLYLYNKGAEFLKDHYQTEIHASRVKLNGFEKLIVDDFKISKAHLEVSIKKITVDFRVDPNFKKVSILNLQILEPHFQVDLSSGETKDENSKGDQNPNKPSPLQSLEDLILAPPNYITLHRLEILKAHGMLSLLNEDDREVIQQLNLGSTDLTIEPQFLTQALDLKVSLKSSEKSQGLWVGALTRVKHQEEHLQDKKEKDQKIKSPNNIESKKHKIEIVLSEFALDFKVYLESSKLWSQNLEVAKLKLQIPLIKVEAPNKVAPRDLLNQNIIIEQFSLEAPFSMALKSKHLGEISKQSLQDANWNVKIKSQKINSLYSRNSNLELNTKGDLKTSIPSSQNFNLPFEWNTQLHFQGGPWYYKNISETLQFEVQVKNLKSDLKLQTPRSKLVDARIQSEYKNKNFQVRGQVSSKMNQNISLLLLQKKIDGFLKFPFALQIENEKKVQLQSKIIFQKFNFTDDKIKIVNLNGEIPITQNLTIKNIHPLDFEFNSLYTQNPFERVDYQRADPFVRGSNPLFISSIGFYEKTFGPWSAILDWDQNLFSIHSFNMDFQKGNASGEMFIDLNPQSQRGGFLGRVSQLDLTTVLPDQYLVQKSQGELKDLPLNMRVGLVYYKQRRSLEGRLDISKMGSKQLNIFINLLDPNFTDPKFNKIRNWISMGYPEMILLNFHEGLVDLLVRVKVLDLNYEQKIDGISIQSFIDKAMISSSKEQ